MFPYSASVKTAEKIGFRARGVKISFEQLKEAPLLCIIHWNQNHFVVLLSISLRPVLLSLSKEGPGMKIADPAKGILTYTKEEFLNHWMSGSPPLGGLEGAAIALLLEPTPSFYDSDGEKERKLNSSLVFQYLKQSKSQISQVFVALLFLLPSFN